MAGGRKEGGGGRQEQLLQSVPGRGMKEGGGRRGAAFSNLHEQIPPNK